MIGELILRVSPMAISQRLQCKLIALVTRGLHISPPCEEEEVEAWFLHEGRGWGQLYTSFDWVVSHVPSLLGVSGHIFRTLKWFSPAGLPFPLLGITHRDLSLEVGGAALPWRTIDSPSGWVFGAPDGLHYCPGVFMIPLPASWRAIGVLVWWMSFVRLDQWRCMLSHGWDPSGGSNFSGLWVGVAALVLVLRRMNSSGPMGVEAFDLAMVQFKNVVTLKTIFLQEK